METVDPTLPHQLIVGPDVFNTSSTKKSSFWAHFPMCIIPSLMQVNCSTRKFFNNNYITCSPKSSRAGESEISDNTCIRL